MGDVFELFTPPPGGIDGLRRKLDEPDREKSRAGWLAGAHFYPPKSVFSAILLAVIASSGLIFSTWRPEEEPRRDYGIFQAVMEGPGERESVVLPPELNPRLSLVPQESSNPKVKLYWIEESDG